MRYLVVPLVLAVFIVACARSPETRLSRAEGRAERAITELEKATDADALAAAGLLRFSRGATEPSLDLFDRAVAASPARADLVWLQVQGCRAARGCDSEPKERRLREIDPANGAGWLGALARADSRSDTQAKEAALAALGRSQRVDVYWTTLIASLSQAVAGTHMMSLREAEVLITGDLAAEALPAYRVASDACNGEQLQRAARVGICRAVAKAFQQGDTYLTEMVGVAIAKRVWPEEAPEWRAAIDVHHVDEYRLKLAETVENGWSTAQEAETYLSLCRQNRREQDLFKAVVIRAGLSPEPPPG